MSQEAHHERRKQMTRQRKKLGWKDEREGAEIKAEKKNGKGRWVLRRRTVTFLLMEHNKPSSLCFPPVGAECQSISCPINMSEEAKQTNKQKCLLVKARMDHYVQDGSAVKNVLLIIVDLSCVIFLRLQL